MKKVIIVGAGIGGLTLGNLLAKKGHAVTIFESHEAPGGYTAGFWRKGFYFESGTLSFESSGTIFKAMQEIGVLEKIEFVRQKSRWVSADFDGMPETFADFKDMFRSAYPEARAALDKYFVEVDQMVRAMLGFAPGKKTLFSTVQGAFNLLMVYRKYAGTTTTDFTAKFFAPDSILFRFFKNIGYPDMAAWILGGAVLTLFEDYWTVKNGMQSWADVLAEEFKKNGGELRLSAPVAKILTRAGAAIGVASGQAEYPGDIVVSACDYKKTFLKLLEPASVVPVQMAEKIERTAVSEGFFTVYLGLSLPVERLESILQIPHVMYFDEHPGIDIHNSADAHYFEKASIVLYSPSLHNPALAPAGKSSLMLQAVAPHRWMNNWGGGDRQRYRELKEQVKRTLIQKAAVIIPDLRELIEFEDAATPLTYERYTRNTDGATSAWSWNPNNKFYKNFTSAVVETPIRNLLIGSCWATQIGGVPGAIGAAVQCARKIG